jgi:hypothetical protein
MTHRPVSSAVTRRVTLAALATGSLVTALTAMPALAGEATPGATPHSRVDHPLNGAWAWSRNLNGDVETGHGVFHRNGVYVEYDTVIGVGVGFWRATSETEAQCLVQYQDLTGTWQRIAGPEELFEPGYVPAAFTYGREIITIRADVRVNDDGAGVSLSGGFVVYHANGSVLHSTTISRNGTRQSPCE